MDLLCLDEVLTTPLHKKKVKNYPLDEMLPLETKQSGYRVLVGKPEGKRPLGRSRRRWEDNIKMDLQEVGGGRGDWLELAQDRDGWRSLVGKVRNFRVP